MMPTVRRLAGALAVLAAALGASTVRAQPADPDAGLERAEAKLRGFEYDAAVQQLRELVTGDAAPDVELRARAMMVRALASAGDMEAAQRAARDLYERDPGYEPDEERVSPRIRAVYIEAREQVRAASPAPVDVSVLASGDRLTIDATASPDAIVDEVVLGVGRDGRFEQVAMSDHGGGAWRASIPSAPALRYYVRYLAPSGHVVAAAGRPTAPRRWVATSAGGEGAGVLEGSGSTEAATGRSPSQRQNDGSPALWWGVAGAAAAVLAVTVGLVVARPLDGRPSRGVQLP